MKKFLLTLLLVITCIISANADPSCKLGDSLSTIQSEFPSLRHLRNWPTKGDQYVVYHDTGASTAYYFKNGRCVLEEFTVNTDKQKANYYFDRFVSDFANQNYIQAYEGYDSVTFIFSYVKVTVSVKYFAGTSYLCKVTYSYR